MKCCVAQTHQLNIEGTKLVVYTKTSPICQLLYTLFNTFSLVNTTCISKVSYRVTAVTIAQCHGDGFARGCVRLCPMNILQRFSIK